MDIGQWSSAPHPQTFHRSFSISDPKFQKRGVILLVCLGVAPGFKVA